MEIAAFKFFFYCCDFYLLILIFFAMHVLISVSFFSLENDRLLCRRTDPQWKYSVLFDDTITKSVEPCLPTLQRDQIWLWGQEGKWKVKAWVRSRSVKDDPGTGTVSKMANQCTISEWFYHKDCFVKGTLLYALFCELNYEQIIAYYHNI